VHYVGHYTISLAADLQKIPEDFRAEIMNNLNSVKNTVKERLRLQFTPSTVK
jgi:hypothetical protein